MKKSGTAKGTAREVRTILDKLTQDGRYKGSKRKLDDRKGNLSETEGQRNHRTARNRGNYQEGQGVPPGLKPRQQAVYCAAELRLCGKNALFSFRTGG
ncbi:hypothetical protein JCM15765_05220 [Paradesulfitobacterium aromaticivorans]